MGQGIQRRRHPHHRRSTSDVSGCGCVPQDRIHPGWFSSSLEGIFFSFIFFMEMRTYKVQTGMVLVTETFTVECVRFRCLLGTDSLRFQLPGAPSLKAAVGSPTTTPQVPEDSVRPASPKPTSPPTPWTSPPRHEETSDEELLRHQHPHSQLNKPESQTSKLSSTQTAKATDEDSLQQAIDEAKQRDDLVRISLVSRFDERNKGIDLSW